MVNIIHRQGNMEKQEVILKAAQKRLGMYGFKKTTMSEIASDVHLSKASLYYYFPDKEHLLQAVLSKEQDEYLGLIASKIEEIEDPEMMIREFVRLRHKYFKAFLNLAKFRFSDFFQIRPHFNEMIDRLRSREAELFTAILVKGGKKGIFDAQSPVETSRLFLEIIHGLRMIVIRNTPIQELTEEDYNLMYEKHKGFLEMFIASIRKHTK